MRGTGRSGPDVRTVAAARGGDRQALDALVADSLPLVYNIVGRALDGHSDVDDVVQETLLRVVRSLGDLRDPAAYRSWLVAIAVRQVRDHEQARRAARQRSADLDTADRVPDPASDFAAVTILRLGLTDQRREVASATRWLDGDDRALLALWWLEGTGELDRAELAHALGLSGRHTAVRVQRMKEQMETARTVVRALEARSGCPELRDLARSWDGVPSPLWRKRFARHVRGCGDCGRLGGDLLPMDRLLGGLPLLVPPVGAVLPQLAADPYGSPTPQTAPQAAPQAGLPAGPRSHRRRGVSRGTHAAGPRRVGRLAGAAAVAAVAAAVAGVLVAGHLTGSPAVRSVADGSATPRIAAEAPAAATSAQASATASPSPTASPTASADRKPSRSPSARTSSSAASAPPTAASPAARPKPAAPAPAVPVVSSAKKGVGVWTFPGSDQALAQSGAGWYYTWSAQHPGVNGPASVGFVPMVWGAASTDPATLAQAKAAGPYLLGFNEPDMGAQSNMTVDQALSLWPKLMDAGRILGSPAVAYGGDTPGGWLDRFMSGAASRGYRVDFITLHWYGGDFTTDAAVGQLRSYLQAVHDRYGKPIWLTEFALIDFSQGTRFPTAQQQAAFVTAATRMLDGLPYVQRYAWFGLGASDTEPSSGLFRSGPVATEAGRAFQAAR
ncbi:sigma-70 family RNA polymerase sigma factor [Peterkaempfera bronchialis]|uniref:Glycosyl hydrolase n=1 Tax=Peterkaempfera bronchialis TaxID=2126346 RepID=A0A345T333_9ACTN|nr:sigma-70 family RNA polymerase sigma factor [Peterkaempfera bronchialis]AXI80388.1 glycosyl hydrolase [Peterkaempfera bronchialis]